MGLLHSKFGGVFMQKKIEFKNKATELYASIQLLLNRDGFKEYNDRQRSIENGLFGFNYCDEHVSVSCDSETCSFDIKIATSSKSVDVMSLLVKYHQDGVASMRYFDGKARFQIKCVKSTDFINKLIECVSEK